jgi:predicted nucleotidyltransferase
VAYFLPSKLKAGILSKQNEGQETEMKTVLETGERVGPTPLARQLSRLLDALTEKLQRQLGSDLWLLLLYGSHARGEAQPDSDVDLFVVLRRPSEAAQEKVRQVAYDAMWEADFAYVISLYLTDVHHYETLEQHGSSFLRNVQREGKVLWKAA